MAGFDNDVVYGINADYSNTLAGTGASTTGQLLTNSQLWIGTTVANAGGTHVNVGTLTSPGGTIAIGYSSPNITLDLAGGGSAVETLTGNTGVATPSANNINVITANSTVKFVGSGSTLTQDFAQLNILLGTNLVGTATGTNNISLGRSSIGPTVTNGSGNVSIGSFNLPAITSGFSNVMCGGSSGSVIDTGQGNCSLGVANFSDLTSGVLNLALGNGVLTALTQGNRNICIGAGMGGNYTSTESNNLLIFNAGTNGESNTIRIGTQGSSTNQQNRNFQAGIAGVTTSNSQGVTIDTTTGQLGSTSMASTLVTTFNSGTGNWTANARTQYVKVYMWGGGAGGGSGRKGTTGASFGGGSGGSGQVCVFEGPVSFFSGTIAYSIAASANGGAAQSTDATDGNPGTVGNNTTFGSLVALGGLQGSGGTNGSGSPGQSRATLGSFAKNVYTTSATGGGSATAGNNGFPAGTNSATASYAQASATSGGGGGGADVVVARAGGDGGNIQAADGTILIAGAAGGIASGTINGANGSSSTLTGSISAGLGGGGGGGCFTTTAGTGGNGSAPGGGGGGGGGGLSVVANSGAGGSGAAGRIIIVESF